MKPVSKSGHRKTFRTIVELNTQELETAMASDEVARISY